MIISIFQNTVNSLKTCVNNNRNSLNTAIGNADVPSVSATYMQAEINAIVTRVNAALGAANADVATCSA